MKLGETMSKGLSFLDAKSPQIKIGVGVVGLVAAGVIACVKAFHLKENTKEEVEAINRTKEDAKKINDAKENPELVAHTVEDLAADENKVSDDVVEAYSKADYAKDVIRTRVKYVTKLARTFAVPIGLGIASCFLIFSGSHSFAVRNIALAGEASAATAALENVYRRIREKYGEEVENEIRYGLEYQKVKEKETDDEGKTVTVNKKIPVVKQDPTACSPYAFIFDERFGEFVNDVDFCENMIRGFQATLADKLYRSNRRYVVLNDLFDLLRAPADMYTAGSMRVGWLKKYVSDGESDSTIDLRIQRVFVEKQTETGTKMVARIMLNPNVEGDIYGKVLAQLGYKAS